MQPIACSIVAIKTVMINRLMANATALCVPSSPSVGGVRAAIMRTAHSHFRRSRRKATQAPAMHPQKTEQPTTETRLQGEDEDWIMPVGWGSVPPNRENASGT